MSKCFAVTLAVFGGLIIVWQLLTVLFVSNPTAAASGRAMISYRSVITTTTPSATPSLTPTLTFTPTPSLTPTQSVTPTATLSVTKVPVSFLPVAVYDKTATPTPSPTPTETPTPTLTPTATITPTGLPPDDAATEAYVRDLLTAYRAEVGLDELPLDDRLVQAARRHAFDMADNNLTSHIGSDGSTAGQRITQEGYDWSWHGEIIVFGFGGNSDAAVNWWKNSSLHSSIIQSSQPTDMGVGFANRPGSDFTTYWTVTFGKPSGRQQRAGYICTWSEQTADGGAIATWLSHTPCP